MNLVNELPYRDQSGNLRVVVESPRGSRVKLKYDEETNQFVWSRPLSMGVRFPYDFGFVPQTLAEDGDALDAMVYAWVASYPGVVVPCRVVGALRVEQQRDGGPVKRNDRLLVVPRSEHRRSDLLDVNDLPARIRDEIVEFFRVSLVLTGKQVEFRGWAGPDEALEIIETAHTAFSRQP